jgi:hypothetical protein
MPMGGFIDTFAFNSISIQWKVPFMHQLRDRFLTILYIWLGFVQKLSLKLIDLSMCGMVTLPVESFLHGYE